MSSLKTDAKEVTLNSEGLISVICNTPFFLEYEITIYLSVKDTQNLKATCTKARNRVKFPSELYIDFRYISECMSFYKDHAHFPIPTSVLLAKNRSIEECGDVYKDDDKWIASKCSKLTVFAYKDVLKSIDIFQNLVSVELRSVSFPLPTEESTATQITQPRVNNIALEQFKLPPTIERIKVVQCSHLPPNMFSRLNRVSIIMVEDTCDPFGTGTFESLPRSAPLISFEVIGCMIFPPGCFDWIPPTVKRIRIGGIQKSLLVSQARMTPPYNNTYDSSWVYTTKSYSCSHGGELDHSFDIFELIRNLPKGLLHLSLRSLQIDGRLLRYLPKTLTTFSLRRLSSGKMTSDLQSYSQDDTKAPIFYCERVEDNIRYMNQLTFLTRLSIRICDLVEHFTVDNVSFLPKSIVKLSIVGTKPGLPIGKSVDKLAAAVVKSLPFLQVFLFEYDTGHTYTCCKSSRNRSGIYFPYRNKTLLWEVLKVLPDSLNTLMLSGHPLHDYMWCSQLPFKHLNRINLTYSHICENDISLRFSKLTSLRSLHLIWLIDRDDFTNKYYDSTHINSKNKELRPTASRVLKPSYLSSVIGPSVSNRQQQQTVLNEIPVSLRDVHIPESLEHVYISPSYMRFNKEVEDFFLSKNVKVLYTDKNYY